MAATSNPPLQFVLDSRDVTDQLGDQFSFSNADPGGFEMASLTFSRKIRARRGAPLVIRAGLQIVWMGRVAENQPTLTTTVQCEGIGAKLKDGRMREIYRDIDLGRWGEPSRSRQDELSTNGFTTDTWTVAVQADPENASPAIAHTATELNQPTTQRRVAESWYDAQGLDIGRVAYELTCKGLGNGADSSWTTAAWLLTQDTFAGTEDAGTDHNGANGPTTAALSAAVDGRKFALIQTFYSATYTSGAIAGGWAAWWRRPAVYGNHGLALRGAEPDAGFYPDDIARDALRRMDGIAEGVFQQAPGFIVGQSTYMDPVPHEQPINDMAKLVGFHWGVWEPMSIFDTTPRLDFRAPPTEPTVFCSRADMGGEPDLSERLADLYDTVQVSWTDSGGSRRITERTVSIPELTGADIGSRVLSIDMGLATEASADLFVSYVLGLQRPQSRASGSVILPGTVGTGSGRKPAMLLQSGLDRLAITDLPVNGTVLSGPPHFHVRRVEVTGSRSGISTTVSLDAGSNLIEVLVAQLALKTQIAAG